MARKPASFRIDERCLTALGVLARGREISVNLYLEELLFSHAQVCGAIERGAQPLEDSRGRWRREKP